MKKNFKNPRDEFNASRPQVRLEESAAPVSSPAQRESVRVIARRSVPGGSGSSDITPSEFKNLPYRSLPWGLSWKSAPGVWLFEEDPSEFDNIAHQGERFEEFLGDVVTEIAKKSLQHATVWRSRLAGTPVIFIEQSIGVMRRLWCVIEFERVAGGSNIGVRVRRMVPRNLDVWDWTFMRPLLGFPFLMLRTLSVMAPTNQWHDPKEIKELEKHASATVCLILLGVPCVIVIVWWVLLLVLGIFSSVSGGAINEVFKAFGSFLTRNAPTPWTIADHWNAIVAYLLSVLALSFFVYMFVEAKEPWPNDQKKSQMLYHTVRDAIGRAKLSAAARFGW